MTADASELSASDLRSVLDVTDRLAPLEDPVDFTRMAANALIDLVPCDFASFNVLDPVNKSAHISALPGEVLFEGAAEALARNFDEHPIVSHFASTPSPNARRLSEFISQRQFHETRMYDEVFKVLGNEFLLASAPLVLPTPVIIGFGLHRSTSDFSTRDQTVVDLASPRIAHAYEATRSIAALRTLNAALDHEELPVVVVDRDAQVLHITSVASDLLSTALGRTFPPGTVLPISLPTPKAGNRSGRGVLGALTWECVGWEGQWAVMFQRQRRTLSIDGLSAREDAALALVAQGLSNAEVARELTISVHTVRRHLESIYRKLDVHTRSAATAAYLRATR